MNVKVQVNETQNICAGHYEYHYMVGKAAKNSGGGEMPSRSKSDMCSFSIAR